MRTVLFYDGVGPKPYDLTRFEKEAFGGTEATVLRIAAALAGSGDKVAIHQHCRTEVDSELDLDLSYNQGPASPDIVITLRDAGHYVANRHRHPTSRHYLWLHDMAGGTYTEHLKMHLEGQEADLICVSDSHLSNMQEELGKCMDLSKIRFKRVYNPVDRLCAVRQGVYSKTKLLCTSSPHKGRNQVYEHFLRLVKINPEFKLYVANPGYCVDHGDLPPGVTDLGPLPHKDLIPHLQDSLCIFYPQTVFPESFGIVLAEANACGTPVICHPMGAAQEVLLHPAQLVDCNQPDKVIERVLQWYHGGRPIVGVRREFMLPEVLASWRVLFNS